MYHDLGACLMSVIIFVTSTGVGLFYVVWTAKQIKEIRNLQLMILSRWSNVKEASCRTAATATDSRT
jgi:hypothetical protein